MNYKKQPQDVKFRIVSLTVSKEPDFQSFDSDSVNYNEQKVLEIQRADGSTVLEYDKPPIPVTVNAKGNELFFKSGVPMARVWLRAVGSKNGVHYKVPNNLREADNYQWLLIPGGVQGFELCGDKYFEKVYSFSL